MVSASLLEERYGMQFYHFVSIISGSNQHVVLWLQKGGINYFCLGHDVLARNLSNVWVGIKQLTTVRSENLDSIIKIS